MFTGIVKACGTLINSKKEGAGRKLRIRCPGLDRRPEEGASISVNGVCLTVENVQEDILQFHAVNETLQKTTLGQLKEGDPVNIEPSLRVGDTLGGHFVLGHVEGMGTITSIREREHEKEIAIKADPDLVKWIVPKGCVAIDGISLTPVDVQSDVFTISLIPETLKRTNMKTLSRNDKVNIEIDLLSRYAARHLGSEDISNFPGEQLPNQ